MFETAKPIRARPRAPAARALALVAAAAIAAAPASAPAQEPPRGMPIIRDTEIENLLRDYVTPILRVAGLAQQNIKVVVLNVQTFNAFVMDGRHIFINAGALFQAKTPNEIIGVLAHETGHLADGHLMRFREKLAQAQTQSIVAMLLGIGAVVAGAATHSSNMGQVGGAAIMAPQSAILHGLLAYARTQEDQADHAGVKFLTLAHESPKGMVDMFKRLSNEMLFNARYIDPYVQTHPMPAERVAALERLAHASPYWNVKDPPQLQLRHDMVRAKLSGFLEPADTVARRYPASDQSLPARYARAISAYRHAGLQRAMVLIDGLIKAEPNNPYFHELKGQALLEGGRAAEAIPSLRSAVQLSHHAPLIEIMLAQALVGSHKNVDEAVSLLNSALRTEPEQPQAFLQLAMAYGRKGDYPHADLASAQAAFARGDLKTARQLAERAKRGLPVGSPAWVRADDIVSVKMPKPIQ
jgi:predicted Zn-dependent protease